MKPALPDTASLGNPIDVIGDAGADRYEAALNGAAEDANIDGVVVLLTPQVMTPVADVARAVARMRRGRPLMPVTAAFMGGQAVKEGEAILAEHGIPCYPTPERAMAAMAALRPKEQSPLVEQSVRKGRRASAVKLLQGKQGLLSEHDTKELFALYDLPLPAQDVATSADHAVKIANTIGYPVIAKVSSPDIVHKTDIGAVRANLKNDDEVRKAVAEIEANVAKHEPNATMRGVFIQKFLPIGNEFIVGSLRDPSFGPLIMVGLGGIYTELFRDTAFRAAPIDELEAYGMLKNLKSWKLLLGMRGAGPADIATLAEVLAKMSVLVHECPEIQELDCNPVLVGEAGVVIADVKALVEPSL